MTSLVIIPFVTLFVLKLICFNYSFCNYSVITANCHQKNGFFTNLYPLYRNSIKSKFVNCVRTFDDPQIKCWGNYYNIHFKELEYKVSFSENSTMGDAF